MARFLFPKAPLTLLITVTQCFISSLALGVPPSTGRYHVGRRSFAIPFVDTQNPSWPGNVSTSYIATIYYPTFQTPCEQPYVDSEAAPLMEPLFNTTTGTLDMLSIIIKPNASIAQPPRGHLFPTLVFQPGLVAPSTMYQILLTELASRGYAVAALDFPYEAAFVRYPNGTGITGTFNDDVINGFTRFSLDQILELIREWYEVRVEAGKHFVESWPALVKQLGAPFQTAALGVFGQSFGGAAMLGVANALRDTNAVASALNLDGQLFGDPASNVPSVADIKRPVWMLGQPNHILIDPTWATFSAAQTDSWHILYVAGADHNDFSDIAFWRSIEGSAEQGSSTIDPMRMVNVTREFVTSFFNHTMQGQEGTVLSQLGEWPEVTVFAQGNGTLRAGRTDKSALSPPMTSVLKTWRLLQLASIL